MKKTPTVSDVDSRLRDYVTAYAREHAPGKQPGEMTREELLELLDNSGAANLTESSKGAMIKSMVAEGALHRRRSGNQSFYSLVDK